MAGAGSGGEWGRWGLGRWGRGCGDERLLRVGELRKGDAGVGDEWRDGGGEGGIGNGEGVG